MKWIQRHPTHTASWTGSYIPSASTSWFIWPGSWWRLNPGIFGSLKARWHGLWILKRVRYSYLIEVNYTKYQAKGASLALSRHFTHALAYNSLSLYFLCINAFLGRQFLPQGLFTLPCRLLRALYRLILWLDCNRLSELWFLGFILTWHLLDNNFERRCVWWEGYITIALISISLGILVSNWGLFLWPTESHKRPRTPQIMT